MSASRLARILGFTLFDQYDELLTSWHSCLNMLVRCIKSLTDTTKQNVWIMACENMTDCLLRNMTEDCYTQRNTRRHRIIKYLHVWQSHIIEFSLGMFLLFVSLTWRSIALSAASFSNTEQMLTSRDQLYYKDSRFCQTKCPRK